MKKLYKLFIICLLILNGGNALKAQQNSAYQAPYLVDGFYEIYNADNLFWFAEYVNSTDETASAKLMNDIDLEDRPWTPIGFTGESNNNFCGHFDGNGKTITGLYVDALRAGLGFFGEVRLGTVEDFTIYGEVKLNGKYDYVGGLIGSAPGVNSNQPDHNGATIRNITSYVNVTLGEGSHGSNRVAGFIGYANHETLIENCTWYGTLDLGPYRAQDGVGGLVGKTNDNSAVTIRDCAAYGTIKTSYKSKSYNDFTTIYIGGIVSNSVSSAQTTLENCVWAGTLVNNTDLGSQAHISAIGTLNGSKSVTNCYALNNMPYVTTNNAHNTGITVVTAEQLASGEVAYKLQGTQETHVWGQNVDKGETKDACPMLGGAKVYMHTLNDDTLYSNYETLIADGKCGDNLYWHVDGNTLTIFGAGAMYDYGGPSTPWSKLTPAPTRLVLEEGMTSISDYAFYYSSLTGELTIPNSVISIGEYAFLGCSGFTGDLTIPDNVTTIGDAAFWECTGFDGELTIGNNVNTIGDYAFESCQNLTGNLTIPNSVTTIEKKAFYGCSSFNGTLTIPNSVTAIGNGAFNDCSGLTGDLTIPSSITAIGENTFNGCSGFNGNLIIPDSVTYIGSGAFYDCSGLTGNLTIPDNVASIGDEAFSYCSGLSGDLVIPNAVTSIGNEAFYYCSGMTGDLVIPDSITNIGDRAFGGCSGFTKVYSFAENAPTLGAEVFTDMNENVTLHYPALSKQSYEEKGWLSYFSNRKAYDGKCGDNLYWGVDENNVLSIFGEGPMYDYGMGVCPWPKNVYLTLDMEEGITHIGRNAFSYRSNIIGDLVIPNSVTYIENYAFEYCSGLTGSLTIPDGVTYIGTCAFSQCYGFNGTLTLGDNVSYIGSSAFNNCYGFIGDLIIPNSVTAIESYTFQNCVSFNGSLTIGDGVVTIGERAFEYCYSFTGSLTLGNSLVAIGMKAFWGCIGFTGSLTIPNTTDYIGPEAFYECHGFNGTLTIGNSVVTIDQYAFYNCSGFTGDLVIPDSVTSIGYRAFYNCYGFNGTLTIGNSVTHIGDRSFYNCHGFTGDLIIPNSVTMIDQYAFNNCYGFNGTLTIGNSVTTIHNYAFENCSGFTGDLIIPNSVTSIGSYTFYNCSGFKGTLTIGDSVFYIGYYAFESCSGLIGDLIIPNSVAHIGDYAFFGCWGFDGSLVIGKGVSYLGDKSFQYCSKFTDVYCFKETAPGLRNYVFDGFNADAILYYPATSEQSYNENGWFSYFPKHIGFRNCGDSLYWCVGENDVLTIFGIGAMRDYDDDSYKAPWRDLETSPTSLVFKGSITSIGDYAFTACSALTGELTIPNSVTYIGDSAFDGCLGFNDVRSLAETAPTLGENAFANIDENAILYYNILGEQSYDEKGWFDYFPNNIAFGNCGDNLYWYIDDENTLTLYGKGDMWNFDVSNNKAPWRSSGQEPTSLLLDEDITSIGDYAFYGCSGLTGFLTIPNSVTSIGDSAFESCSGFTEVMSLAEIAPALGEDAFANINENATLYYPVANEQSYEEEGWFNYFDKHIAYEINNQCGDNLYWYIDEGNALTIFGTGEMWNYGYTDDDKAPWRSLETAPTSLVMKEGITYIGNYAFQSCYDLTGHLTIPESVTAIGEMAFANCYNFTGELTMPNNIAAIGSSAFQTCTGFTGELIIPNSVVTIGDAAFYGCSNFTGSLTIPDNVTSIGYSAFENCSGFNGTLTIGNSVETIGGSAFDNCYGFIGSLTIPNSVVTIGASAFNGCAGFNGSLTIGNSVETIGNWAFAYCSGFTGSLIIPNSVTKIDYYAFRNCSGFTGDLIIGNKVANIGSSAFFECSSFASLTIGNSVETIDEGVFTGCSGFTGDLTIPYSVTFIGADAFSYCSGLTEVFFYRNTEVEIGPLAFSHSDATIYVPIIWSTYPTILNLAIMPTYTILGWIGLAENQTEPGENDHVAINAPLVLGSQQDNKTTRQQGSTANSLSVKSFGYCGNGTTVNGSITIEDGGQLYCEEAKGEVTVKKEILGYEQRAMSNELSWYTIASPLKDVTSTSSVTGLLTTESDLYRYDEPTHTWQNAKPGEGSTNFQTIDPGRGYLYANAENTTLEFTGMINTDTVTYNLTTDADVLTGFHLVGNPFTHDITFAHLNATEGAELVNGYYVLNGEGAWGATLGNNEDDVIKLGQGALVKAKTAGTLAISRKPVTEPVEVNGRRFDKLSDRAQQQLKITVANAKHSDKAFVVFDKGVGLDKINHENENVPLLYIPMDDADYAIAMMDINVNEIPVSFETNVMGQYTISLQQENCEFDELYILDKQTGEKVNILENDYTFIATSNDAPERFVLLKDIGQQPAADSHFAYVDNNDIVVYDIEGKAQIRIFDAMGRCLYKGNSTDAINRVPTGGFSAGVYVIQKADDNGVKVQKIILE